MNKQKIKDLAASIKAKQEELRKATEEEFKNGTKELFDKNPELKSFGFTGWVPYFNDGDTCRFNAHIEEPDINGENGGDISYGEKKHLSSLQEKVADFLGCFDNDFYESIFGEHFETTITRNKITTEEYTDHD